MKKSLYALLTLLPIVFNVACKKEVTDPAPTNKNETQNLTLFGGNVWVAQNVPDVSVTSDEHNQTFTTNNLLYVALTGTNALWQYDPSSTQWSVKKSPFFNFTVDLTDTKCVFTNGNNFYFLTYSTKTMRAYNLVTAAWTTVSTFPGTSGTGAAATYTPTKGYIIGGGVENWEYDFVANTWTQKAPCPGFTRWGSTAYAIGNNIYFGTGITTGFFFNPITQRPYTAKITTSDWYAFNITSNTWMAKAAFGGGTREEALGFVVNGKIYMGMGDMNVTSNPQSDLWCYDPVANSWTQKATIPGGPWPPLAFSYFNWVGVAGYGYAVGDDIRLLDRYTAPYTINFPALGAANAINMP
jgi:N-acetylneuraminic acid mutarotase